MAKSTRKSNGTGRLPIYKSYVFRDKDPAIDEMRTLAEDHFGRKVDSKMLNEIHESGGPSVGCMASWFFGTTKRPTNPCIEAAGRSMGYKRTWVKMK
jgi:hypothetical protein